MGRSIGVVGAAGNRRDVEQQPAGHRSRPDRGRFATLVLRWIAQSPGRVTLAAGRVAGPAPRRSSPLHRCCRLTGFTTGDRPSRGRGSCSPAAVATLLAGLSTRRLGGGAHPDAPAHGDRAVDDPAGAGGPDHRRADSRRSPRNGGLLSSSMFSWSWDLAVPSGAGYGPFAVPRRCAMGVCSWRTSRSASPPSREPRCRPQMTGATGRRDDHLALAPSCFDRGIPAGLAAASGLGTPQRRPAVAGLLGRLLLLEGARRGQCRLNHRRGDRDRRDLRPRRSWHVRPGPGR